MTKYKLVNGWTCASVMERIREKNKNKPSMDNGACVYRSDDGNRCFVGAFIPPDHKGLDLVADAYHLIDKYPDLALNMPFCIKGLREFQIIHDKYATHSDPTVTLYEAAEKWLAEHAVNQDELGYEGAL